MRQASLSEEWIGSAGFVVKMIDNQISISVHCLYRILRRAGLQIPQIHFRLRQDLDKAATCLIQSERKLDAALWLLSFCRKWNSTRLVSRAHKCPPPQNHNRYRQRTLTRSYILVP